MNVNIHSDVYKAHGKEKFLIIEFGHEVKHWSNKVNLKEVSRKCEY